MQPKVNRYWAKNIKPVLATIIVIALVVLLFKTFIAGQRFAKDTGLSVGTIIRLIFNHGAKILSSDRRTNVLILGIGGGSHEGADLTDTMLVLSLDWKTHGMALISVPRDIWSDTLKDKINSAYHYGEEKKKGGGMILAKAEAEDVIGTPIHYAVVVDFTGFKKVIDLTGGVSITVPLAFIDPDFPIEGRENDTCNGDPAYRCRYKTIHFDQGIQIMDGERALTYVRSRHAEGAEGSDFARSKRQQDLIVALKGKLASPSLWLSPQKDLALSHALDDATDTDMNIGEFLTVGKFIAKTKPTDIQKISIEDLLTEPPLWLYGRYVLVPKEDFEAIHTFIKAQLK